MSHIIHLAKAGIARALVLTGLSLTFAGASMAGRPLAVDDANINGVGSGHVEIWYERQPGGALVGTVAPAIGLTDWLELSAGFARDSTNGVSTNLVQARLQWTPSRPDGCNLGTTLGVLHAIEDGTNTPFVNGMLTCNASWGAINVNLGSTAPANGPGVGNWGIAFEHAFEAFTAHAETFGQERTSPRFQMGFRKDIAKGIQLDATVGRADNDTILSLGMKLMF